MTNEAYILGVLGRDKLQFPPLKIVRVVLRPKELNGRGIDALLDVAWNKRRFRFAATCKAYGTPKMIREAVEQAQRGAAACRAHPLVVAPYLSEEQLRQLERRQVSGLDLSGNCAITVPGELLVFRTGQPNRFPQSAPIKNIYQGASSLVPRVLLARPRYPRVGEVLAEIRRRGGVLTLSTVSKVLKTLEENLLINRDGDAVRLSQPAELLAAMQGAFRPPVVRSRLIGKASLDVPDLIRQLSRAASQTGARLVMTGVISGSRYAVAAMEPVLSCYVSQPPESLLKAVRLSFEETPRFANLQLLWTDEATVYFDARVQDGWPLASPVQTYLEMAAGDKRLKQTADQVKSRILADVRDAETK